MLLEMPRLILLQQLDFLLRRFLSRFLLRTWDRFGVASRFSYGITRHAGDFRVTLRQDTLRLSSGSSRFNRRFDAHSRFVIAVSIISSSIVISQYPRIQLDLPHLHCCLLAVCSPPYSSITGPPASARSSRFG